MMIDPYSLYFNAPILLATVAYSIYAYRKSRDAENHFVWKNIYVHLVLAAILLIIIPQMAVILIPKWLASKMDSESDFQTYLDFGRAIIQLSSVVPLALFILLSIHFIKKFGR